jgi:hypothetical protein
MTTQTPEEQPYVSEEDANRRTNLEALAIIVAGFLFLCAPTLLCFPQYRMAAALIGMMVFTMSIALGTLLGFLQMADLLTRLGLRKRKQRFLSAEELEARNTKGKR